MKLSILIPTLNEPESIRYLKRLRDILDPQVAKYQGEVEVRIHDAPRSMNIGIKRNELIQNSDSEFFVFIDCDDWIADTYVQDIMNALQGNPDCVTFKGWVTTNGINRRNFLIRLGSEYYEKNDVYYRWPNHLAVMKRSLVEHVKFPPVREQEDFLWSREIHNKRLLKTEVFIDKDLYHYMFIPDKTPYRMTERKIR